MNFLICTDANFLIFLYDMHVFQNKDKEIFWQESYNVNRIQHERISSIITSYYHFT